MSDMYISPNFKKSDWNKLYMTANDSSNWSQAVEIFKDRIQERYLKPIKILLEDENNKKQKRFGFIIMSIDSLLIETLGSFREGKQYGSKEVFFRYLSKSEEFKLTYDHAKLIYDHFRCGLLHQAEVKYRSKIKISGPIHNIINDKEINVNRIKFHNALQESFDRYCKELLDGNDKKLRANFIKKMNFICG